jgi:hypothetical protein
MREWRGALPLEWCHWVPLSIARPLEVPRTIELVTHSSVTLTTWVHYLTGFLPDTIVSQLTLCG